MANGGENAIDVEQLYRRYSPMVLRRCRRLLQNEEQSVEAMQDVFVRLLSSQDRLHGQFPSSLLFRMATNVCLNIIRDRKPGKTDLGEDALARIACCDEQETRTLSAIILAHLFRSEKSSTREMAVLHFVDGMSYREVASETNLSVSGVRKRLRDFRSRVMKTQAR
jgi:RNA polymerase sigma-70 factor (ECF subfamily)